MRPSAWLCLVVQLSALTHLLWARHSLCPAHGELVELHDPAPNAAHPGWTEHRVTEQEAGSSPNARFAQSDGPGSASGDEHDHCEVANLHRDLVGSEPAELPQASWYTIHRVTGPAPPFAGAGPALYRLAPKTSPPASVPAAMRNHS